MRLLLLTSLFATALAGAEHRGQVKFGGLPVPGASVTASLNEKKAAALTGLDGTYTFPNLADGIWAMQVDMLCFKPLSRDVTVGPQAPVLDWDLKLLPFDEIKASAPAAAPAPPPAAAPLQTTTTSKPPAKGRKNAKIASSAAGPEPGFKRADVNASASAAAPASQETGAPPAPTDANQTSADSFAINGSSNNGAASPFGMSGAFGNSRRGPGSLYNGNVAVVIGNAVLDARSYSLTGQDTKKPDYNHFQFTGAVGGPIRIPHIYRGGNSPATFFVNYQMVRNRNASTVSALVPTQAQRDGNLGGIVVPQSQISPQALALLKFYPLPNFDSLARYNYQTALTGANDSDALQTRISKTVGRSNQVFGTFGYQNTRGDNTNLFGFLDTSNSSGIDFAMNWSHRFSQRVFSTYKFQFNRLASRVTPYFANQKNVSGEAGITGNNQDPLNWGPPNLSFASGIYSLSDTQQSFTRNQTVAGSFNAYWNRSPHNFTFGADYKKLQVNYLGQQDARGNFGFTGAGGSDFGSFLRGTPDTSSIAFGNADKYFRSAIYDAYFTDDWRLSPSFTLNAGARWEYTAPITEKYGRLVNLDITPDFANQAPVVANHPAGPVTGTHFADSLLQPVKSAFQPRVGIAWRPIPGSSLVIRGGYGVTYDTSVYQAIANRMAQQSPLSKSLSVQNTAVNPLTLANGFNASPNITTNTFAVDPNFRIGYAQSWQAQVQRDLRGSLVMTATYLGIKGTRAQQAFLPNTYPLGAVDPCPACASGYTYLTSNGNSTRHSAQFQLRRRLHNGFTATTQYVFSKAIDDAALGGRGNSASLIAQDWLNLNGERSLSNFDQRHLVTVNTQYSTGSGVKGGALMSGWRGTAFKEWTLTTQTSAGTGTPLTPVYTAVVRGTGVTGSIRPDYTGAALYSPPSGLSLNPAAYTAPAPGRWGNAGRNSITGPNQFTLGASLARSFELRDRKSLDIRLDATNILNHVNFPAWVTNVSSTQFGLPIAANPMRTVQATVRVRF
jgi:hypothetical protein